MSGVIDFTCLQLELILFDPSKYEYFKWSLNIINSLNYSKIGHKFKQKYKEEK